MRRLIIATPRSGSSFLTSVLAKMLKLSSFQEPYNLDHPTTASQIYPEILPANVVVKTMFSQIPLGESDSTEFYLKEIQKFDKVILLSRLDVKASYESFNYKLKNNPKGNWHTKYYYDETKKDISLYSSFLTWTNELIQFSNLINVEVSWYEDIFEIKNTDTIKNWDLKINTNQFYLNVSSKSKYRVETKKDTLL